MRFPSSFLWGAALSSYQTEGDNYNCDWYLWEKERNLEPARKAALHYSLFKEDFQIARQLNLNSLRISIEWSRVYCGADVILYEELKHYRYVIESLYELKLAPVVTLHHFTNPIWFVKKGGWLSSKNIDFFLNYLRAIVREFKDKVQYWLIFNEPLVYVYKGFIEGAWPPGRKSLTDAFRVVRNILSAYRTGYQEIKRIYQGSPVNPQVSLSKNMLFFSPCPRFNFGLNNLAGFLRGKIFNYAIIDYLASKKCLDYVALNYYSREYVKFKGLFGAACGHNFHKPRRNVLNWYISPRGFYDILISLKKYGLPVIITENGTAEDEDCFFEQYLKGHLNSLLRALQAGVDVRGYFWWSLIDNFEWDKGFRPRFGLARVNYSTFKRELKPYADIYAKVCKDNKLNGD